MIEKVLPKQTVRLVKLQNQNSNLTLASGGCFFDVYFLFLYLITISITRTIVPIADTIMPTILRTVSDISVVPFTFIFHYVPPPKILEVLKM